MGSRPPAAHCIFWGCSPTATVHSHIDHLLTMLRQAKEDGVSKVFCHILLDGRDVPATSALHYVESWNITLAE